MIGILNVEEFKKAILIENQDISIDWKKTLDDAGITYSGLADAVGMNATSVFRWYKGGCVPHHFARRIAVKWLLDNNIKVSIL